MKQKLLENIFTFFLGILLTGVVGWSSGYLQVAREAKAFFPAGLVALESRVAGTVTHEAEIQAILQQLKTKQGGVEVLQGPERGIVIISRRAGFRKGETISVTNLSDEGGRSIDVQITGDYLPKPAIIIALSEELAARLGTVDEKTQVEVAPKAK